MMKRRSLGEAGFLTAEAAILAFLLLVAVVALAALDRSAEMLERSEAETSALFLAEGELALMESQLRSDGAGALSSAPHAVEENGRTFTLAPASSPVVDSLWNLSVRVRWQEKGKEEELSLERVVHLGGRP